jgi:hypothetical protein
MNRHNRQNRPDRRFCDKDATNFRQAEQRADPWGAARFHFLLSDFSAANGAAAYFRLRLISKIAMLFIFTTEWPWPSHPSSQAGPFL